MIDDMPWATRVFLLRDAVPDEILALDLKNGLSSEEKAEIIDRAIDREEGMPRAMLELVRTWVVFPVDYQGFDLRNLIRGVAERYREYPQAVACANELLARFGPE